jgi:hypothetical protein
MPETPTLTAISAAEDALQAAWQRKDRAAALDLQAQLASLWEARRAELAEANRRRPSIWDDMPFSVRRS